MILRLRRALLLRAFDLLYHQFSWAYDLISSVVSLGRWRDWGVAGLLFLPVGRVLELGHGPGHLLVTMSEQHRQVVGLDFSPQMSRAAWRRLVQRGLVARLVRGRGQSLPFAAASFDGVIAAFPSPYIIEPQTVTAVWRSLRPGGRWVIVPEAELIGRGPASRVIGWLYAATGQKNATHGGDPERNRFWQRILAGPGFHVTVHRIMLDQSLATVVVAERPSIS